MKQHHRNVANTLALIAGVIATPAALAQDPDARWYLDEKLVFSHEGSAAATR